MKGAFSMKRILSMTLVLALALGAVAGVSAQTSGQEIMEQVYNRPAPDDMTAEVTMTLTDRRGNQRVREIEQYTMKTADGEKQLMFFTAPADVRDTSFMTWSYDDDPDDDQWIYLPQLNRVRRIASDSKHDRFMGSDFTYDDISGRHPDEDEHELLREEQLDGRDMYVVDSRPKDTSQAPFSRTVTWVDPERLLGARREYFDSRDNRYKVLELQEAAEIDGFWIIERMTMTDESRDHSTTMEIRNARLETGLDERMFSERTMTRGVR